MIDDAELLRRYADERAEDAFAEIVRRHLDLVYGVALRKLGGDAHLAQDAAQRVFIDLARKARVLREHPALAAWLFTSAQFAATQLVRVEARRRAREERAEAMNAILREGMPEPEWERLRPVIDDAISELNEGDREAVVLRFFEGCSFAVLGARLRLSEDGARSRVERALEKLRGRLMRRGIESTAAALGVALTQQAAFAAPAELAGTVTTAALGASAMSAGAATVGLIAFMSTNKTIGVTVVMTVLAIGFAGYEVRSASAARTLAMEQESALSAKARELEQRVKEAASRVDAIEADNAKLAQAIDAARASTVAQEQRPSEPVTEDMVHRRMREALGLMEQGQFDDAVKEILWCRDVGFPQLPAYVGTRFQVVANTLVAIGKSYPPAMALIRTWRDEAEARMKANPADDDARAAFVSYNRELGDLQRTLAFHDSLPPSDPRKRQLGAGLYEQFIENRRYTEAAQYRNFGSMLNEIDGQRAMEAQGKVKGFTMSRAKFYERTGKSIELLAGTGRTGDARELIERLLGFDGSETARQLVRRHLERAGRRDLLPQQPE